jgi:hypothetical protein
MGKRRKSFVGPVALIVCIALGLGGIVISRVFAGEGYGNHYCGGTEDFSVGALPPAGTSVFINYLVDYNATTLRGNAGRNQILGVGQLGYPKVSFKLNVLVDAMRYLKMTNIKLLGGDLLWHVIVPFGYQKVSMDAGPADMGTKSKTSLGDIEFGAGIAWHSSKTFHHAGGIDIVAPTGAYSETDLSNIGRNYWSFNPIWSFTYIGDKDSPIPGFEVSSKFMYWINTINTKTSYTSGQEFAADYLIGQHFGKWAFGANGHFLYQTTNDKQYGSTAYDPLSGFQTGVKGKYLSIGPAISYEIPHGCITLKYQRDVWAENRPEGDKFWLKWVYAF